MYMGNIWPHTRKKQEKAGPRDPLRGSEEPQASSAHSLRPALGGGWDSLTAKAMRPQLRKFGGQHAQRDQSLGESPRMAGRALEGVGGAGPDAWWSGLHLAGGGSQRMTSLGRFWDDLFLGYIRYGAPVGADGPEPTRHG